MDRHTLVKAAARRARVRTAQGEVGVLVYAPGTRTSITGRRELPRHGDRTKCGVWIEGHAPDTITAIPVEDVVEIIGLPEVDDGEE